MSMDRSAGGIDALYREVILDHHRHPRNQGKLEGPTSHSEGYNPLCGDRVEIDVLINDGKVMADCRFRGEGCSICMASASMMTEELIGKPVAEVSKTIAGFRALMKGEECPLAVEGDLESLVGVRNFPVRIKCALLPWTTLNDAINQIGGAQ
ncbi:MAG: Fe-S cluster assembly sulfur transfer protein SufU [Bacteriovoracia bacterium]